MSVQKKLGEFEAELGGVIDGARQCVTWLRSAESDDLRFLVAERLPTLGRLALPELMSILGDPQEQRSVRYLAAWVALEVGDRGVCVSVICQEVDADSEWSLPAAGALARRRIKDGIDPVVRALMRVDPRDDVSVMGYATALRDLGGVMPAGARRRLVASASPWVSAAIRSDFPD